LRDHINKREFNPSLSEFKVDIMKYEELTYDIISCAFRVHQELGNGFQEKIYHRAMNLEFMDKGMDAASEVSIPIYYKEKQIGFRKADFIVENKVMVELKAVLEYENAHLAQAFNYLTILNFDIGLLLNFGGKSLQYKRVYNRNSRYKGK